METTNAKAVEMTADMLSATTKSARMNLLFFAFLGLFMAGTNALPSKLNVFGLEFPGLSQGILYFTLSGLLLFHLFAFVVYRQPDRLRFLHLCDVFKRSYAVDDLNSRIDPGQKEYNELESETDYRADYTPMLRGSKVARRRAFWDFDLPLYIAALSLVACAARGFCHN